MTHLKMTGTLLISTQLSLSMNYCDTKNSSQGHEEPPGRAKYIVTRRKRLFWDYLTLTSFMLREYFKFVEMRNSRSLLERDQNFDFQIWWPKMKAFLFDLTSKLLVRTLKMLTFLIVLLRIRYSFSSPSVSYWLKFRVCRDFDCQSC